MYSGWKKWKNSDENKKKRQPKVHKKNPDDVNQKKKD